MASATSYTRKLYLFGPMEARTDNLVQPLRRKTKALLAYLAAERQARSRSFLCNLFLPETDDPLSALNWHFSQIRRRLGSDALLVDADLVQLNHQAAWVDCVEFRRMLESPLVELAQHQLQAAIDLYRGEFLEALALPDAPAFELWVLGERAAYRRLVIHALDEISSRLINTQQYDLAITYAQQQLQLDPLIEEVHRRLIWLYAQTGQRQAAFRQYEQCLAMLRNELALEPSPQLQELHKQLLAGSLRLPAGAVSSQQYEPRPPQPLQEPSGQLHPGRHHHVLPAQRTPFWGRQREQAVLAGQLARGQYRLFSLIGPGGIGKTRLALQLARTLHDAPEQRFVDGVYFIPLASVASDDLLVPTIADALGMHLSGATAPLAQLLAYLRTKNLLLVLDNFEHLMASTSILTSLLEAPAVVLLVTSRVRLNLYEEWSLELKGLEAPDGPHEEHIAHYSAVQLFVERARLANQDFTLDPHQAEVARICQLLEGMPLAIELAAGWLRAYSCAEIVTNIQQDLDFLATDYPNVPDRHRSMRIAFEHSWRLLAGPDRAAFARLSVFRDSFDHNAADHVAGVTRQTLARLADHSMIARTADNRWHIHELLRQFAAEKLAEADAIQVRHRHSAYFAGFVQQRVPLKMTRQEPTAIAEIHLDLENVRAGWRWAAAALLDPAFSQEGAMLVARYAPMLCYYFERRSRFQEGVQIFQEVADSMEGAGWHELADSEPATLDRQLAVVRVGIAEATLSFRLGQLARAGQVAGRCIALMHKPQLAGELAAALVLLGRIYIRTGSYEKATACFLNSLALSQQRQDQSLRGLAFSGLASIASNQGRFDEAESYYTQSIALFRQIDYPREVAINLNNLGANFVRRDQPRQAQHLCQEALDIAKTLDEDLLLAVVLSGLGGAYRALHEYDQAQSHLAQSLQISRRLGDQRWTTTNLNLLGLTLIDAGNTHAARPYLVEALETAMSIGSMPDALDSLAALAEIADNTSLTQRLAALHFVIDHPAARPPTLTRGKRVLASLQEQASVPHIMAVNQSDAHTLASLAACYLTA